MRTEPQFKLRIPASLLDWLKVQATKARRSVTAEINYRLEQSRDMEEAKEAQQ